MLNFIKEKKSNTIHPKGKEFSSHEFRVLYISVITFNFFYFNEIEQPKLFVSNDINRSIYIK